MTTSTSRHLALAFCAVTALAGCVTGAPNAALPDADLGAASMPAENPAATSPTPPGFCADDIYARYLMKTHAAGYTPQPAVSPRQTAVALRRARRGANTHRRYARLHRVERHQGTGDAAALAYARRRFSGPPVRPASAMPVMLNDQVDFWLRYFAGPGRRQSLQWLVRAASVRPLVEPLLTAGGVSSDFLHLAMIESGLSNGALSHARAMGTWQFISGTATLYGLKINHWVDERRDPVKSTMAAAAYLRDLYAELGDWHLAMAAYNAGPGTIRQAIRRGRSRDFWTLANAGLLPLETKHYVPKVLAAALLAQEPARYGFAVAANPHDAMPTSVVNVPHPVRLSELAAKLGVPLASLMRWNPEIIRNITPPRPGGYPLRLAPAHADQFANVVAQLTPLAVTDVQVHHIRKGETLAHIARLYKVALKQILAVNPDLKAHRLRPGTSIAIPIPGIVSAKAAKTAPGRGVF